MMTTFRTRLVLYFVACLAVFAICTPTGTAHAGGIPPLGGGGPPIIDIPQPPTASCSASTALASEGQTVTWTGSGTGICANATPTIDAVVLGSTCASVGGGGYASACTTNGSSCLTGISYSPGQTVPITSSGTFCSSISPADSSQDGAIATFNLSAAFAGQSGSAQIMIPENSGPGIRTQSYANEVLYGNYAQVRDAKQRADLVSCGPPGEWVAGSYTIVIPDIAQNYSDSWYSGYFTHCDNGSENLSIHVWYAASYDASTKILTVTSNRGGRWKKQGSQLGWFGAPGGWIEQREQGYLNGKVWGEVRVLVPAPHTCAGGETTDVGTWSGDDGLSGSGYQVQKSYTTPGLKTALFTITNEVGSDTAECSVTISGSPNLTAGSVSPITATVNQSVTLTATIVNTGSVTTGAGFSNLFQVATDANGTGATVIGQQLMGTLGAGASEAETLAHTFSALGTSYVRACADLPPYPNGGIAESNENNNCGAWTAVTVSAASPPTQCADGIDNNNNGLTDTADTSVCSGPGDTTESTQCSDGLDNNGNTLIDTADVGACANGNDDNEEVFPNASLSLTLVKPLVRPNERAALTWSASNVIAGSCTLTGDNGDSWALSGSSGNKTSAPLTAETIFTLSCRAARDNNVISETEKIRVTPKFEEV